MKNKSDAIIALSVIACSLVLLGALFFSVAGNPFEKPHLTFSVDFEDLTGIQRNSAVLFAGDEVGYVDEVAYPAPPLPPITDSVEVSGTVEDTE